MLEDGISSTDEIPRSFGIATLPLNGTARAAKQRFPDRRLARPTASSSGTHLTIEIALRVAGFMR